VYKIIIKVLFIKVLIEQVKEQSNFYWSLKRLKELRLKKCVWRNASEESALKTHHQKKSHQKQGHQKQGYQKHLIRSHFTKSLTDRVDKVQCTKCTTTNYAHAFATTISASFLYIKTRITVILLQALFRLKWNGFEISSSKDSYQIRQKINGEESKLQARQVDVPASSQHLSNPL